MKRMLFLVYGAMVYLAFLLTFLYAIGFVGNFLVPRSMDRPPYDGPLAIALLVDALLLGVFALQHSVMARQGFKRWWTRIVPPPIERSTYVLAATLALALLMWQWRPVGAAVWDVAGSPAGALLIGVQLLGWGVVLLSTFLIDHWDLFGLKQVWFFFRGRELPSVEFQTPSLYKVVRHPIYLGFHVAFWATPVMTVGHLVFAVGTTAYMLVAIQLEERDLIRFYGDIYRDYRRRARMLVPLPRRHIERRSDSSPV